MATLAFLRRRVLIKMGNYSQERADEADFLLNIAQDTLTRDAENVQLQDVQDISQGVASYNVIIPTGYALAVVRMVTFFDGMDYWELEHKELDEMNTYNRNWRSDVGPPQRYVRNINLTSENAVSIGSVILHPIPTIAYMGGLITDFAGMTQETMKVDADASLWAIYDDALVAFACAEMGHPDAKNLMAKFDATVMKARSDTERGWEEHARRTLPYTERSRRWRQ